jgi:hypothetical protein
MKMTRRQYMFKWNLGLTARLAYALSTVMILFLSSAFISLANADTEIIPPPDYYILDGSQGSSGTDLENEQMSFQQGTVKEDLRDSQDNQEAYRDRWQMRKSEYRLLEEYAAWLRDHEEPGSGTFGPAGFGLGTIPMPTFFDILINIF